ncbi:diacylglycerol kinase family protein [Halobacillus sp. Marseille-Q1614]|uniref:diacylglycerol kinase family protein n=1 Tax=Halobacillus sp. Marseille-Q1614 TaxID=2709134 RepID=UPI00156DCC7B|nr:diacylglycerol kinase family protein [Halobacillus sp. Marseille-Q1614]
MSTDLNARKRKYKIGFNHAFNGLKEVYRKEGNFKIHILAAVLAVLLGVVLKVSLIEWTVLTVIIVLVFALEMVNTSIERIMDYLAPERHPLVGEIKDIAAGAVLIAALGSVIIGCLIFIPKLMELL